MSSFTVFGGNDGFATRACEPTATMVMGAKSLIGSEFSFVYSAGAIVLVSTIIRIV